MIFVTKILEKSILFRCEENMYNTMVSYAHSHGFKSVAQLVRGILLMHFMSIMLGEKKALTRKQLIAEIESQYKEFLKSKKKKRL